MWHAINDQRSVLRVLNEVTVLILPYLDDVLKSKESGLRELATPALKVGVDCLCTRWVLQMVGHLPGRAIATYTK